MAGLRTIMDGEPWFGESLSAKLDGVTPDMAFAKPMNREHSIAEIVCHMDFWRRAALARIRGENAESFTGNHPDNWPALDRLLVKGWEAIRKDFAATQAALMDALGETRSLPPDVAEVVTGTLQHDVYHLGQIGYVKKLVS